MSSVKGSSSGGKVISFMLLVVFGCIAYFFIAPLFLPMWRWQNVDFPALAAKYKIDPSQITKEFEIQVRYHPRKENIKDPMPWQLLIMDPTWESVDKSHDNEHMLAVRCTLVSEKTGTPPSMLFVGNTFKDRYFKGRGWRLPPGALGFNAKRPVIIYQATLDKLSISDSMSQEDSFKYGLWEDDDNWDDRDDGFRP